MPSAGRSQTSVDTPPSVNLIQFVVFRVESRARELSSAAANAVAIVSLNGK
jgi:hypothetical protein